jgi:hypothetical protein
MPVQGSGLTGGMKRLRPVVEAPYGIPRRTAAARAQTELPASSTPQPIDGNISRRVMPACSAAGRRFVLFDMVTPVLFQFSIQVKHFFERNYVFVVPARGCHGEAPHLALPAVIHFEGLIADQHSVLTNKQLLTWPGRPSSDLVVLDRVFVQRQSVAGSLWNLNLAVFERVEFLLIEDLQRWRPLLLGKKRRRR